MLMAIAQIRARQAFRYGYFGFLGAFFLLLVLVAFAGAEGTLDDALIRMASVAPMMALALVIGLAVPLFFACWSLFGAAFLGLRVHAPSLLEGIND